MSDTIKHEYLYIADCLQLIKQNDLKVISINIKHCQGFDQYADSRSLLLKNLHQLNLNTILLFCYCEENYSNIQKRDWWLKKIQDSEEYIESPENFEKFANDMDYNVLNYIRDNYIFNIYFEFEIKVRNIVRQLGDVPNPNDNKRMKQPYLGGTESWFFIYKGFFDAYLKIRKEDTEVIELYTAIRNTIHNGGFYYDSRHPKLQMNFMNQKFTFENLKPIGFINFGLIQNIYNMLLELIDLAYSNSKLSSVKLIKDPIANVKFL
jgi:hypothetical protein